MRDSHEQQDERTKELQNTASVASTLGSAMHARTQGPIEDRILIFIAIGERATALYPIIDAANNLAKVTS